jgi:glycerol-3-phosphate acyltransferase PlsY
MTTAGYAASIAAAYLTGAIPFSYLLGKWLKGIDIRQHGSGNPGATNVFRVMGPGPGIAAFLLDFSKGFIPAFLAAQHAGETGVLFAVIVGLAAILGHMFTVFLRFRGGKGVATGAGVFMALLPVPTLAALAVFGIVFLLTRYVSLGSIAASLTLPVISLLLGKPRELSLFAAMIAAVIIIKHHSNIRKLRQGTEHKFGSDNG